MELTKEQENLVQWVVDYNWRKDLESLVNVLKEQVWGKITGEFTPEQINLLKELKMSEWYRFLLRLVDELVDATQKQILQTADNYSAVKSHWYTVYEILWAFMNGLKKTNEIVEDVTTADEKKEAVKEVNESEAVA